MQAVQEETSKTIREDLVRNLSGKHADIVEKKYTTAESTLSGQYSCTASIIIFSFFLAQLAV